ncbi:unnamed protein product [Echinostoma caproni]|uniref:ADSL_C domain-containing protein n=1 Tax=Echinostoma caproni TaxID=27848 RepID=A0A183AS81_9TREM|nr:unnamed protein product [Echinostoma caproni]
MWASTHHGSKLTSAIVQGIGWEGAALQLVADHVPKTALDILFTENIQAAGNATNKEYLEELEQTLKSFTIPENAKQTIQQTVVPALMRRGKANMLSNREDEALETLEMDKHIVSR